MAFFTLGDSTNVSDGTLARLLLIFEAGTGFGFIALTISYLPVLQQHFFRRDVQLIQLAARAGSPPTPVALILWHVTDGSIDRLEQWLREWELWAAELIESHSSYPMLAFYRSQHENHSWLGSLAVVLDCCAILLAGFERQSFHQTEGTFLVTRRVLQELCRSLDLPSESDRLEEVDEPPEFSRITAAFSQFGDSWTDTIETRSAFLALRATYAHMLARLSKYLLLPLPSIFPANGTDLEQVLDRRGVDDRLLRS